MNILKINDDDDDDDDDEDSSSIVKNACTCFRAQKTPYKLIILKWMKQKANPCSLSLRLLGSLRGSLGTYGLTQKLC